VATGSSGTAVPARGSSASGSVPGETAAPPPEPARTTHTATPTTTTRNRTASASAQGRASGGIRAIHARLRSGGAAEGPRRSTSSGAATSRAGEGSSKPTTTGPTRVRDATDASSGREGEGRSALPTLPYRGVRLRDHGWRVTGAALPDTGGSDESVQA